MSTMRTKASAEGNAEPQEISIPETETNKREPRADDERVAVYVKISHRAKEILDAAATGSRTRATVIEALLESFHKQRDPVVKRVILEGQSPTDSKEQGELLQFRSWAEHAFENERYFWAGEMYKNLANHPATTEGLRNICEYRLSLCLIRLSYDVREEALERSIDRESYHLALKTLDRAITYTCQVRERLSSDFIFPKLVLNYNLACCHALKAQYLVESDLDPTGAEIDRLRKAPKNKDEKAEVWKTIGEDWRQKQEIRNIDKERQSNVDLEAGKAFDQLQQIFPVLSHGKALVEPDIALFERVWLVDSSADDEDLIFLRSDKQRWQGEFKNWRTAALRDRKPNSVAVSALLRDVSNSLGEELAVV